MVKKANNKSRKSGGGQRQQNSQQGNQSGPTQGWRTLTSRQDITNIPGGGDIRVRGSEVLGTTGFSSNLVFVADLNPAGWVGTRTATLSNLFEKYKINSCTITVLPAVGTSGTGVYYMYIDTDPSDKVVGTLQGALSQYGAVVSPAWQMTSLRYAAPAGTDPLNLAPVIENSLRDTSQGILYVMMNGAGTAFSGSVVKVDYDITFLTPQLNLTTPTITTWTYDSSGGANLNNTGITKDQDFLAIPSLAATPGTVVQCILNGSLPGLASIGAFTAAAYATFFIRTHSVTANWRAYATLVGAITENDEALITQASGVAGTIVGIWWRRLVLGNQ